MGMDKWVRFDDQIWIVLGITMRSPGYGSAVTLQASTPPDGAKVFDWHPKLA